MLISEKLAKELDFVLKKILLNLPEHGSIQVERQDSKTTYICVFDRHKIKN